MSKGSLFYRWREELLAGISGGLLLALSFPPFPTRFFSVLALVPVIRYFIIIFPERDWRNGALRRGFFTGYLFGLAFFGVLLYWVANLIPASRVNMRWVLVPAVVLFVMYLSLFTGLFTFGLSWLARRYGSRALFAAPALWALMEFMRSNGELGFSWGLISSSLVPYPVALQGLSLYGPFGFSMVLVLANVLIAFTFFARKNAHRIWAVSALAVLAGVHLWYGAARIERYDREKESGRTRSSIAVVQPNVDLGLKWKQEYIDTIFTQVESLTEKAAAMGADVVIFPETAAPVSISHSPRYSGWLKRIAREHGLEILIGYINHIQEQGRWRAFNAAGLFDGNGSLVAQYHKINLLPFGEKIPFSQYFPSLEKIDFGQANFKPGQDMTIFRSSAGRFGVLICFESTFSNFTRKYVNAGADFLVNITNDGWFGSARGPLQHAESAVLRAVENGVPLVRSANTGVSMVVDPVGRIIQEIGLNREGIIMIPVTLMKKLTLYCRYGHLSFFLMFFFNLGVILLPAWFQKH